MVPRSIDGPQIEPKTISQTLGARPRSGVIDVEGKRKATAQEVAEIARMLGVGVDEVLARLGTGVVSAKRASEATSGAVAAAMAAGVSEDLLELPVPMTNGGTARLMIPRQLSKVDAERIAALLSAFAVK